ncbi:MAG: tetratricopeptide repeat protein [Flavobacteriaceae bacterium]
MLKKSRFLILCLCLLAYINGSGQTTKEIDSLKSLLRNTENDSEKIFIYNKISETLILEHVEIELGQNYADSAHQLASIINDKKGITQANYNHALINKSKGDYDLALKGFQGFVDFYKKRGDSLQVAEGLYNIGVIHNYLGEYHKNLNIQFRILRIYEKAGDRIRTAHSYYSIGNVNRNMKNYDEAIEFYRQSTRIYEELKQTKRYAMGWFAIANVHFSKKEYKSAITLYEKALAITQKGEYNYETAFILSNLGATYEEMNENDKALSMHLQALKLWETFPAKLREAYALDNVGYMLYKMKRYQEADSYFSNALSIAEELGSKPLLMEVYQDISDLHLAQNNFEKAFNFNILHNQMKDSIYNEDNAKQINELQTKYQTAEKEKEIALLTKEREVQENEARRKATQTNAIIGGLAFILLLAGLLFYIFRQRVKNQKLVSKKNAEIIEVNYKQQLSELEMKALRAQMNPHFVFNCLNSINRMILGGDIKDASSYLTKFSRLIRKVLENSEKSTVSVSDELTMLKAYIQLESLRFKGKISYKTEIDKNINLDTTFIPSMVLQPLVENAIWHGLMHKETGGTIMLSIAKADNVLKCSVEDDGVGREKNVALRSNSFMKEKSMGLQLTSERLKVMGKLGLKRFMEVIDLKDDNNNAVGTRVDLLIPIA